MLIPIYRLVYFSRNEIVGDDATICREITQILHTAREKNPKANITGALMFNADCFAQVLEGAYGDLQDTFERIQCDPRHSQLVLLAFEPSEGRRFSNWSMAFLGTETTASQKFADILQVSNFDASKLKGDYILELLTEHLLEAES